MGSNATEIRTKRNPKVINRDGIKYIAAVPMIIGHAVGYFAENGVLENNTLTMILTSLALFAPPIFFFSIADGYKYTSSRKKYALRLLLFAAASQIPFAILNYGTIFTLDALLNLNVFFTLLAGYFFRTVFYSGKKGKHPVFSKWFFYIVYPAHLALIYILVLLLKA